MTGIRMQWVDGFAEVLRASLLKSPESRLVVPNPEVLLAIMAMGRDFILAKSRQEQHRNETIYTIYKWPESGPAVYGICWARNGQKEVDHATGKPVFVRYFTETEETTGVTINYYDLQQQLARYASGHMGRPQLVK